MTKLHLITVISNYSKKTVKNQNLGHLLMKVNVSLVN